MVGIASISYAQNISPVNDPKYDEPVFEEYQFYLTDPAIKILDIQYEKDCTPVKGRLSEDGKTVILKEYREHSRIYFKYQKANGTVDEISKSPCYIDPVIHAL